MLCVVSGITWGADAGLASVLIPYSDRTKRALVAVEATWAAFARRQARRDAVDPLEAGRGSFRLLHPSDPIPSGGRSERLPDLLGSAGEHRAQVHWNFGLRPRLGDLKPNGPLNLRPLRHQEPMASASIWLQNEPVRSRPRHDHSPRRQPGAELGRKANHPAPLQRRNLRNRLKLHKIQPTPTHGRHEPWYPFVVTDR